jgi:hypothetical protein
MRQMVEALTCDRCKKDYEENGWSSHFSVSIERYCDAAGSSETRAIYLDLCGKCQAYVLGKLLSEHDWQPDAVSFVKKYAPNAQVRD